MSVTTKTFVLEDENAELLARVTVTPGSYFELDAEWGVWSSSEVERLEQAMKYYYSN